MNGKLSDEQVRKIRERYAESDATQSELADAFGTSSPSHIGDIVRGEQRSNVPGPIQEPADMSGETNPNAKLSDEQVREIRERYAASDASYRELSDAFGVTPPNVGYIVRGEARQSAPGPIQGEDA